jgi:hypothetical protein
MWNVITQSRNNCIQHLIHCNMHIHCTNTYTAHALRMHIHSMHMHILIDTHNSI